MANKLKDVAIKVAASNRSRFSLPENLYTTFGYGKAKAVFCKECVPGDTIDLSSHAMIRCAPLADPAYVDSRLKIRFFFVPSRLVQSDFQDFIAGIKPVSATGQVYVPTCMRFSNSNALAALAYLANVTTTQTDNYDFSVGTTLYTHSNTSRRVWDILLGLGYDFTHSSQTTQLNALPLLAYCRTLIEWYTPSQYINSVRAGIENIYKSTGTVISRDQLQLLFNFLGNSSFTSFDTDYFNGAFTDANGNITNLAVTQFTNTEGITATVTPQMSANIPANSSVSYNTLRGISAFQDWVIRKAKSGYRYFENLLAEWGVTPESARIDRVEYLGTDETNINISDVTSTADTATASLGSYAGRGIGASNGSNIHYECREHGYVIGIATCVIDCPVFTGRQRHVLHTDRLDFFTPEFENVGVQALRCDESYSSCDVKGASITHTDGAIKGYVPRYWEYKMSRDKVTGGFRFSNQRLSLRNFINGRWYDAYSHALYSNGHQDQVTPAPFTQDFAHALMRATDDQSYNNNWIFQVVNVDLDPFIAHIYFDVNMTRPMASVSDTLPNTGDREIDVPWTGVHM